MKRKKIKKLKSYVFWVCLAGIVWMAAETICFLGLCLLSHFKNMEYKPAQYRISSRHRQFLENFVGGQSTDYRMFDADLGWSPKKDWTDGKYTFNAQGLRANRSYSRSVPQDKIRISTFGDSYTFSSHVPNENTWQSHMEKLDPRLEVLNFGVGTYGVDQAYLRYLRDGVKYESDIVLIGFLPENTRRHVNVFRPFYSPQDGLPLTKPRFLIRNNELVLQPNPILDIEGYRQLLSDPSYDFSVLSEHDDHVSKKGYLPSHWDFLPSVRLKRVFGDNLRRIKEKTNQPKKVGYYDLTSAEYRLTEMLLDQFRDEVIRNGEIPMVVIFVRLADIRHYCRYGERGYQAFLDHMRENEQLYIDVMDVLGACGEDFDENNIYYRQHQTNNANKIVADYIHQKLIEFDLIDKDD